MSWFAARPSFSLGTRSNPLALVGGAEDAAADDDAFTACAPCEPTEHRLRVGGGRAPPERPLRRAPELDVAHPSGGAVPAGRGARARPASQRLPLRRTLPPTQTRRRRRGLRLRRWPPVPPLAYHFPDARFVLVDAKRRSLDVARRRADAAGLANVRVVEGRIEDFDQPFDVGIALHACGAASDFAMEKCVAARAAYVVAPCCVGKISSRCAPKTFAKTAQDDGDGDGEGERAGGRADARRRGFEASAVSSLARRRLCGVHVIVRRGGEGGGFRRRGLRRDGERRRPAGTTDADTRTAARRRKTPRRSARGGGARARAHRRGDEDRFESVGRGVAASVAGFAGPDGERAAKKAAKVGAKPRATPERLAERELQRRACKSLVEADRNRSASGRHVADGDGAAWCTPKNDGSWECRRADPRATGAPPPSGSSKRLWVDPRRPRRRRSSMEYRSRGWGACSGCGASRGRVESRGKVGGEPAFTFRGGGR